MKADVARVRGSSVSETGSWSVLVLESKAEVEVALRFWGVDRGSGIIAGEEGDILVLRFVR